MKVAALLPVLILGMARALAQAPPGSAAVQAEIAELLVAYPNTQYFWQQTDIARRLVAIGDPAVVDSIELYLDTTDRRRRCNAAYVLAAFGDERGTQVLIGELEDTGTDKRDMREGVLVPGRRAAKRICADKLCRTGIWPRCCSAISGVRRPCLPSSPRRAIRPSTTARRCR